MSYLDELKLLTDWESSPELTEDDLTDVLANAAVADQAGRAPTDAAWSPTYDMNTAASKAWLIKAARAASKVDSPPSGEVTAKVFDNCRAMARIYAAKRCSTVVVTNG